MFPSSFYSIIKTFNIVVIHFVFFVVLFFCFPSCRICNPTRFSIGICNPAYMYQLAKHHFNNGCGGSLLLFFFGRRIFRVYGSILFIKSCGCYCVKCLTWGKHKINITQYVIIKRITTIQATAIIFLLLDWGSANICFQYSFHISFFNT